MADQSENKQDESLSRLESIVGNMGLDLFNEQVVEIPAELKDVFLKSLDTDQLIQNLSQTVLSSSNDPKLLFAVKRCMANITHNPVLRKRFGNLVRGGDIFITRVNDHTLYFYKNRIVFEIPTDTKPSFGTSES